MWPHSLKYSNLETVLMGQWTTYFGVVVLSFMMGQKNLGLQNNRFMQHLELHLSASYR